MSSRQRIVLLIIAAVILVGGIAIAAGTGGGDGDEGTTQTGTVAGESTPQESPSTAPEERAEPEPRVDTIRIKGGKPVGGAKELKYDSGDTIALRFVSDAPGEVHIHGYDKELEVGSSAKIVRFKASLEGIFEIEEHDTDELLAKLEVRPK